MSEYSEVFERHAHLLEGFKNGEVKSFMPFLRRAAQRLRAELLKTDHVYKKEVIKAKLAFVESVMLEELGAYQDLLTESFDEFAKSEAEFNVKAIASISEVAASMPSANAIRAAITSRPFNNKLLKDYLNAFTKDNAAAIRNAVSMGFFEGKATSVIIKEVIGTIANQFQDGTFRQVAASAERVVRTSINHISNVVREQVIDDNKTLLPYYEIKATLDSRTSQTCMGLDGRIYEQGKGPVPPFHYNCRTIISPLLKSEAKKTKSGYIKTVDDSESYNDFLKRQSKAFQDEQLGATKAKLFRNGGLTVDKFVNNKGIVYTLDELKRKYPTAWAKANIN